MELQIVDVAFGGKGVAREGGKAIFIPYTIDGERVSAHLVREKKHFAEAELREVIESSAHRVPPECPYFGRCGGCVYQHMSYAHQLEIKARQVEQTLKRIGHLNSVPMRPIVASPQPYAYRNRITVHCEDDVIGFYRRDEHRLIDIERCPIAMPQVNAELQKLRARHPRDGHFTLRAGGSAAPKTMLKNAASPPKLATVRAGRAYSENAFQHFSQINDAVAEQLLEHVDALLLQHGALLIDAYCGTGFFAKRLLDKFDRVIGIDWDQFAIAEAKKTASDKETYIAGDIETELQVGAVHRTARECQCGSDRLGSIAPALIVDPPATGLTNATRDAITDLAPNPFIYISCNPATLARDLADLQRCFTIESVTPFDMFPQTAEIEVAVKLVAQSS